MSTIGTNQAYAMGLKLKQKELSKVEMIDQLKMQGVDIQLAEQVTNDIFIDLALERKKKKRGYVVKGGILTGLSVCFFVIGLLFLKGTIILAGGMFLTGAAMLVYGLSDM